ncbi:MAG: hypothetical protein WBL21_09830 [Salinimicrobium sp.]
MRSSVTFYIAVTTVFLVALVVLVFFNFSYSAIFYTMIAGQALWLLTVFKILTNNYSTKKSFDDWYEDHLIDNE